MARGSAVREFVSRLRDRFFTNLSGGETNTPEMDEEYQGMIVYSAFERAVSDTLLGSAEQPKPAAKKPRKKRRAKAQIAADVAGSGE